MQLANYEEQTIFTPKTAGYLAYASAATLLSFFPILAITGNMAVLEFLQPLYRLLLIPAVAWLPAPRWAKMGGWLWIMFDSALNIGAINGMDEALIFQLRMGIHLAFAVWSIAVGWLAKGALRWSAILVGVVTGGYSFVAPWAPEWFLPLTALFLLIYIVLSGRYLSAQTANSL